MTGIQMRHCEKRSGCEHQRSKLISFKQAWGISDSKLTEHFISRKYAKIWVKNLTIFWLAATPQHVNLKGLDSKTTSFIT
jgi:hypothetical protein